jgi:hypothetical protein
MRSPVQPVPMVAQRWMSRARLLRWLDALVAWLLAFGLVLTRTDELRAGPAAIVAAVAVALAAAAGPLRVRWRPASGLAGLLVSRGLRPGDRAWYVRAERADLVLVTARHGLRVSITAPELGEAESISVRRTRVFVVPAVTAG